MTEEAVSEGVIPEADGQPVCMGPPPAERMAGGMPDPRAELLRMASKLAQGRNPRLLATYLRLRREAR